ncbi:MAG: type II toxin-antitoxin system prevent-host-death family antitoxin [Candidatus Microthrix sp.]|nr:type II toxin-antitoxin system prevent-host-death family antitoxin [Candidatus Microthrix sp.]
MERVASRELRNQTRALLERTEAGEEITITVNGRDVARLSPIGGRPRSMDSNLFLDMIEATQADPKLTIELDEMMGGETTDDLRW